MTPIYVFLEYDGEWKKVESGFWEWFGSGLTRGFLVDRSTTFFELVDTIYERTSIDRSKYAIEITHKRIGDSFSKIAPTLISSDLDVMDLMFLYENEKAITLHVMLKENNEKDKAICVVNDDNINNDNSPVGDLRDDYFRCPAPVVVCDEEDIFGPNMRALQISKQNTDMNPTPITGSNPTPITGSNPTLEETMWEKVPDEGDDLPEGGDDVIDETIHDSPCQHFDLEKDGALISFDSERRDGSDLRVGRHFESKEELNINLSLVAINGKFEMKVKKSTKTLKEVICVNENCSWRVRATKRPDSNFFVIRQYNGIHTCSLMNRSINHRQASSRVIGARLQGHFKENKEPPNPKSLMGFMREELKVHVSYWKAWRGGKFAQDLVRGTPEHGFAMLPSYCHILKKENPGTVTHIEVDAENKFLYFFMALGVAIRGFRYMRKVIGIDAAFVKTKYKGMLIVASTQDSEYHSYPIAWALVDSEKNASWTWFLEKLKELIPDSSELCFISDRNQSIQNSVSHVYPMAHHGACYYHVAQNIKSKFKSCASLSMYKNAAEAYRIEVFGKHFDEIRETYPRVAKYLEEEVKFEKWSRAHFKGNRYEVMTTNIVESVNSMMQKAREYPITALIDFILNKMGEWFYIRRREALAVKTPLTPKREEILRKRWDEAGSLIVRPLNENEYYVMCGSSIQDIDQYMDAIVNLGTKRCGCRVFDIDKIPCIHAIAAAGHLQPLDTGSLVYSLCSEYYCADRWLLAYAETVYPVPPKSQWHDIPDDIRKVVVVEPNIDSIRGRPRLTRIPSAGEVLKKKYKCGTCCQKGHNSKTCPNRGDPSDVRSTA